MALWRGQCLQDICSKTMPQLTKDKFLPSYSFSSDFYQIAILLDLAGCFDLSLTLAGKPVEFKVDGQVLQFPFDPEIIALRCTFVQRSKEAGQYDCVFRLTITLKSTALVVSTISWTSTFLIDLKNVQASS